MNKIFFKGILPDLTEEKVKKVNMYGTDEKVEIDFTFSDYLAMSIAMFKALFPFVLLIIVVYSIFVYFFLNVWL